MSLSSVALRATGLFTPPYAISNNELVEAFNTYVARENQRNAAKIAAGECQALAESSSAFIEKASGIKSRYVMNKTGILDPNIMRPQFDERSNDELSLQAEIGVAAAQDALARAGLTGQDIDRVVLSASNIQRPYPAVSIEIQAALGIKGSAFDMNVACASAVFGIETAVNAIATGAAKRVLLVNAELCTAHLNFRDRDSHFIFGDAATAMILENAELTPAGAGFLIESTAVETQFSNNIRNNFGFLNLCDPVAAHRDAADKLFMQNGRRVFKEVCPAVGEHIVHHLQQKQIDPQSIKRFWLHQANQNMNQLIIRRILGHDAPEEAAPIVLDRYANTSSAGAIIALHLYQDGFAAGDRGVISCFGAGYSIGSAIIQKR